MVILTSDGMNDTYVVIGSDGETFTVQKQVGEPIANVYGTIEAMIPPSVAAAQAAAAQAEADAAAANAGVQDAIDAGYSPQA